ncbi:MAG: methyl-accepting chemotaxis protein [Dehalococcoidia bacterium]
MRVFGVLDRLSLRSKLIVLAFLPLFGVVVLAGIQVRQRLAVAGEMDRLIVLTDLTASSQDLVHELQKERGRSSLFLGSPTAQASAELATQRKATDRQLVSFQATLDRIRATSYGASISGETTALSDRLGRLTEWRSRVDGKSAPAPEVIRYYTETIAAGLALNGRVSTATGDAGVARELFALIELSRAKEATGVERATLSNALAQGRFSPGQYAQFITVRATKMAYLTAFREVAEPGNVAIYDATVQGGALDTIGRFERTAMDGGPDADLSGMDAAEWFSQITVVIDLVRQVESRLMADTGAKAAVLAREARVALTVTVALVAALVVTVVVVAVVIARGVLGPLGALTRAADGIAVGDIEQSITLDRTDEVGRTAAAFRAMIAYLRRLATTADSIADGDLTREVAPASDRDALGHAFGRMTNNLRSVVAKVQTSADTLTEASATLNRAAGATAEGVSQVTSAVQGIAIGAQQSSEAAQTTSRAVAQLTQASMVSPAAPPTRRARPRAAARRCATWRAAWSGWPRTPPPPHRPVSTPAPPPSGVSLPCARP